MEYTALAFVEPLRRVFRWVLRPYRETRVRYLVEPYFIERIEYRSGITSLLASGVVRWFRRVVLLLTNVITIMQNGSLRLYLGYMLVMLVALLLLVR